MPIVVHAAIAALYVGLALVCGVGLALMGTDLGLPLGVMVGLLVLLAGGLMHDNLVKRRKQRKMDTEIHSLKDAYGEVAAELTTLRKELTRPTTLPIFGVPTAHRGLAPTEFAKEVHALQGLLEKISADRSPEAWEDAVVRAQTAGQFLTPEQRAARRALLGGLDERKVLAAVDEAIREDRLDLFLQPIVRLPSRKRVFWECSCRIRLPEGMHLIPAQYEPIAEEAGLMGFVQNVLLLRTVQLVRTSLRRQMDYTFFAPISGYTLADPQFLAEFVALMEGNAHLAPKIVFNIDQDDLPILSDQQNHALYRLANAGYRFCLDGVERIGFDLEELLERKFRFVKIPAPLLLVDTQQSPPPRDPRDIRRTFDRYAIDVIVSELDEEDDLRELYDHALDFGQGPLLGDPRPAVSDQKPVDGGQLPIDDETPPAGPDAVPTVDRISA